MKKDERISHINSAIKALMTLKSDYTPEIGELGIIIEECKQPSMDEIQVELLTLALADIFLLVELTEELGCNYTDKEARNCDSSLSKISEIIQQLNLHFPMPKTS